jgi:hypothetical protein
VTAHSIAAVVMIVVSPAIAAAQPQPRSRISVSVEARTEGRAEPDATAAQLLADVRRSLAALDDVEIVGRDGSRRTIWIIAGATPGATAASMIVTERYDRETLMVLGIEDDDMAFRMMALQIVTDHQIFTGRDTSDVARRIVTALNEGVFAKLRKLPPRP